MQATGLGIQAAPTHLECISAQVLRGAIPAQEPILGGWNNDLLPAPPSPSPPLSLFRAQRVAGLYWRAACVSTALANLCGNGVTDTWVLLGNIVASSSIQDAEELGNTFVKFLTQAELESTPLLRALKAWSLPYPPRVRVLMLQDYSMTIMSRMLGASGMLHLPGAELHRVFFLIFCCCLAMLPRSMGAPNRESARSAFPCLT